jgi:hypothetical protein
LDEWALMGIGSIASRLLAALVASSGLLSLVVIGRVVGAFWVTGYYVLRTDDILFIGKWFIEKRVSSDLRSAIDIAL